MQGSNSHDLSMYCIRNQLIVWVHGKCRYIQCICVATVVRTIDSITNNYGYSLISVLLVVLLFFLTKPPFTLNQTSCRELWPRKVELTCAFKNATYIVFLHITQSM